MLLGVQQTGVGESVYHTSFYLLSATISVTKQVDASVINQIHRLPFAGPLRYIRNGRYNKVHRVPQQDLSFFKCNHHLWSSTERMWT